MITEIKSVPFSENFPLLCFSALPNIMLSRDQDVSCSVQEPAQMSIPLKVRDSNQWDPVNPLCMDDLRVHTNYSIPFDKICIDLS